MSTLPSPCQPPPSEIGKIAGPLLIGHLLHWALFGALSVQVYIYYLAFPLDSLKRKALVYIIYILELIQAILMATMAFKEFATGFGNFAALDDHGLLWFAVPVLNSVVAAVVQIFYAHRIKILSDSIFLPVLIVSIALVQLGGGIALGALGEQHPSFCNFLNAKSLIPAGIWNAGSALCDVIIAASMTYYLSLWKTEPKLAPRRVQRITRFILETGTLTAAVAVASFALYQIPSHPAYYQTTSAVLGKMYSTTMMVVLNSRIVFSRNDSIVSPSHDLSSVSRHDIICRRPVFSPVHGGITVTREHWSDPLDNYKLPGTSELKTDHMRSASSSNA